MHKKTKARAEITLEVESLKSNGFKRIWFAAKLQERLVFAKCYPEAEGK